MANPIYNTQSVSSLKGYLAHAIAELQRGGEISLVQNYTGGAAYMATLKPNSRVNARTIKVLEALSDQPRISIEEYRRALKNTPIEITGFGGYVATAGNIMKSGEKIPFGYLAEAVLIAAIVARFTTKRDQQVSTADVVKLLKDFVTRDSDRSAQQLLSQHFVPSKAMVKAFEYAGTNQDKRVGSDTVLVLYTLNEGAYKWLQQRLQTSNVTDLNSYFTDSINFVNSNNVRTHSDYFYTNNRRDRIDIISTGITGQGSTKADVVTEYYEGWDGSSGKKTRMRLNLSVKINHVEQVGQMSGIDSQTYAKLTELFGVPLTAKQRKDIDELAQPLKASTNALADAKKQGQIYDIVYDQLAKAAKLDLETLLKGIEYFIAFNAKEASTLTVVDIGSGLKTYFVKNLKNVARSFKNKKIIPEIITGGGAGTTKTIKYSIDDLVLFSISSRYTGGIYRNFLTTGPLLREILSA